MARQVLENGVILPAEYSDDWYDDMTSNLTKLDDVIGSDSEKLSSSDVGAAALSNNYNDLDNLPTIPTVNDATLTIQKNGVDVETFTANASSNVTCNITVPTKTSDLTNDSNFVDTSNSAVASGITSSKVTDYDTHIADTDIHVTTADKATWNTVTSKANDSDVVHKSGDEYITGTKTFGKSTLIIDNSIGSNVHGEIKFNGSRSGYIVADGNSDGVFDNANCGISILLQDAGKPLHVGAYKVDANGRVFADNTNKNPILSITSGLIRTSTLVPENDTGNSSFRILSQVDYANGNPSKTLDVRFIQYDNANATSAIYSNDDGKTSLGVSSKKWSDVLTYKVNGVEPSSLSLPSGNANDVIDISSYITDMSGNVNNYTAPANGWISIAITGTAISIVSSPWSDNRSIPSDGTVRMLYPILKGMTASISVVCTNLAYARFIPCQGNV